MLIMLAIIILVAIDQLLKYLVSMHVKLSNDITLIPHLLDITYVENRGAAFGMLQNYRWFFIVFAVAMISIFVYLIRRKQLTHKMFLCAATLIIGGGIGNFIDRLMLGYVVDYLKLSFFSPVCNFADYCVTIGTVILVIYVLFVHKDVKN